MDETVVSWSISTLLESVSSIFTTASGLVMANPVASAFVGLSLAAGGIGLFRKIIHTR